VVELLAASLFLGFWWLNGGVVLVFVLDVVFVTALLIGVAIDLEHRLIPDKITVPLLVFGLVASLLPGGLSPLESLIGAGAGGGVMYGIAVVGDAVYKRETMGGGDIKLAAAVGAFVGWKILLVALFIAFVLGAAGGLIYLALGGKDKTIPFGPFLAAGAVLALVFGQDLLSWYTGFLR
jgi:leader peptidase (prepilin peptidase)/N-methyltransferase